MLLGPIYMNMVELYFFIIYLTLSPYLKAVKSQQLHFPGISTCFEGSNVQAKNGVKFI